MVRRRSLTWADPVKKRLNVEVVPIWLPGRRWVSFTEKKIFKNVKSTSLFFVWPVGVLTYWIIKGSWQSIQAICKDPKFILECTLKFRFWSLSPASASSRSSILTSLNAPGIAKEDSGVFDSKFWVCGWFKAIRNWN